MSKPNTVTSELHRIYKKNGRLHPPDVVAAARNPDNPLHSRFTWDDTAAADAYRIWQARQLIAEVWVTIPNSKGGTYTVRAYNALRSDGTGYRHTRDIMAGSELKAALMAQMAEDLERVTERYEALRSVASARKVFEVVDEYVGSRKESLA